MERWIAILLIGAHAATLFGHDVAHRGLGVDLVLWQTLYAYALIVAGPLIAGALLFAGRLQTGYGLLGVCMLAAFAFGAYHHYVDISPDHVNHLPHGPHQPLFRSTAGLMAVLELAGVGTAWWGYRAARP